MMRDIAVIGAAGRLGQWVTRDLVEWGYNVRAVDKALPDAGPGLPANAWQGIAAHVQADVSDAETAAAAVAGADAVIYLAGSPLTAVRAQNNALSGGSGLGQAVEAIWQTAAAAGQAGSRRFVTASSLGVYGLTRQPTDWRPLYFPLDERHPVQPQDFPGLLQWLQEETVAQLAREHRFASICLRLPQVVLPHEYAHLREKQAEPGAGRVGLWTYIDVRDVARAFRLALETPELTLAEAMGAARRGKGADGADPAAGGHVCLNVVAASSTSPEPTIQLLSQFFPDVPLQQARLHGQAAPVTGERATHVLGFTPRYSWRSHS